MTRKFWWLPLTGFAFISLASPWPAYSFDYKIHPGSLCQPFVHDPAGPFFRSAGFIFHDNVNAVRLPTVTCPIIRDRVPHEGKPQELTKLDVGIWFTNIGVITGDQTVTCRFISLRGDGSVLSSLQQLTNPNLVTQALFWAVKPEETALDGTYSIDCELPAGMRLLRYVVGEDGETDEGGGGF
jgi:hypothetical protein